MNKERLIIKNAAGDAYVSPAVAVIDIQAEGVLCQSGQTETWEEEEL